LERISEVANTGSHANSALFGSFNGALDDHFNDRYACSTFSKEMDQVVTTDAG
jgi:hypothetical protein